MTGASHVLEAFPGESAPPVRLEAVLRRRGETLLLCYLLRGPLAYLSLPEKAGQPARRERLWEETCFELFLAPREGRAYREVNLSPAGHWNLYAFTNYRAGMRPEAAIASLPFTVARETESLALTLELPLAPFVQPDTRLLAGLSAVLKSNEGHRTHWGLAHPGQQPDFHRRDAFLLSI